MTDGRMGWDRYFITIAQAVSLRGDCRRKQYGAIIVKDHKIIATGYNGVRAGQPGCLDGSCPRGLMSNEEVAPYSSYDSGIGFCISSHAETSCLITANTDVRDSIMYVTGEPCFSCKKLISASGINEVIFVGENDQLWNWTALQPPIPGARDTVRHGI